MSLELSIKQDARLRAACLLHGNDPRRPIWRAMRCVTRHTTLSRSQKERSLLIEYQNQWSALEDLFMVASFKYFHDHVGLEEIKILISKIDELVKSTEVDDA